MSTPYYKTVRRRLSDNCPVMKSIIGRVGPCMLAPKHSDPFTLLVRCIVAQQISTKAAESIFWRLAAAVNGVPQDEPDDAVPLAMWRRDATVPMAKLAKFTDAKYKACGISGPKQRTFRAVIAHLKANPKLLPSIPELDDGAIREQLTAIKGIGPWTVDMYLLFGLGRPDVWPVGDYGIKVAVKNQFRLRKMPDAAKMTKLARPWEPYRSVASWYLWRSLESTFNSAAVT
jgi:DNA-3-methyladenine glycosylase II